MIDYQKGSTNRDTSLISSNYPSSSLTSVGLTLSSEIRDVSLFIFNRLSNSNLYILATFVNEEFRNEEEKGLALKPPYSCLHLTPRTMFNSVPY